MQQIFAPFRSVLLKPIVIILLSVGLIYSQDRVIDNWRIGQDYQIDPGFMSAHELIHDGRNLLTVNRNIVQVSERAESRMMALLQVL